MNKAGLVISILLSFFFFGNAGCPKTAVLSMQEKVRIEANYILACQYTGYAGGASAGSNSETADTADPAYGAINDVYGKPTWVVPRENANAMLGLSLASEIAGDPRFSRACDATADYLIGIQDKDGGWADQYEYASIRNPAKSPTQTAEVLIAFAGSGYREERYVSVKRGALFLEDCADPKNKQGADDGLLCGGKERDGSFVTWRWCHDNSYAYLAFKAASSWARMHGEPEISSRFEEDAERVLAGIELYMYDEDAGSYKAAIDKNGKSVRPAPLAGVPSWIQFSPVFLGLPVSEKNKARVCEWTRASLQAEDGSMIGYEYEDGRLRMRKYPGLAFQAAIMWLASGFEGYAADAIAWAEASGLRMEHPDSNGVAGSFVDWIEVSPNKGLKARFWERFVDTSYYYIKALYMAEGGTAGFRQGK